MNLKGTLHNHVTDLIQRKYRYESWKFSSNICDSLFVMWAGGTLENIREICHVKKTKTQSAKKNQYVGESSGLFLVSIENRHQGCTCNMVTLICVSSSLAKYHGRGYRYTQCVYQLETMGTHILEKEI